MNRSRKIGSALAVVSGSLAAAPTMALELGDATVHSTLGQPLRASIAYALAPNEAIYDTCVVLQPVQAGGAPTIGKSSVSIANGVVSITNGPVIREPLVSFRLSVRCNYTSKLTREYTLFIDPPARRSAVAEATGTRTVATVSARATRATPERRPVNREPIATGSRYLVQPGDSLSLIAQRAASAQLPWRELSAAMFRMNPDAFIDNDPNRLKAGTWLSIPDGFVMAEAEPVQEAVSARQPAEDAREQTAISTTVYSPDAVRAPADDVATQPELLDELPAPLALKPRNELRPGDLILDPAISAPARTNDNVAATPAESISIIRQPATPATQGTNWLLWLAGGGVALILGLALVGRRFLGRFGSSPVSPAPAQPLDADSDTQRVEAIGDVDIDFGDGDLIPDDSPTAENPQLDADLVAGTGFSESPESPDVNFDTEFALAATTHLDIELSEDMSAEIEEPETDIIPPIHADDSSILKGEILPETRDHENEDYEDEDYDISVVIDATKMPDPADVTERDLEAIAVSSGDDDETLISDDYTLSQEADYKILEQDYQDEATAAEALNAELKKAAEDIAASLGTADATMLTRNDTDAHTAVQDPDITARLPANDDNGVADDDDTSLNPTIRTNAAGDS